MKQVQREEYSAAVSNLYKKMEPEETAETPAKIMVMEIEELCKLKDKSVFREVGEGIRKFSWDTLWLELVHKAPTLLHFYRQLFRGASKALICFAILMIIKWRSPKMGLVQRVVSTVFYGNGANKQVSTNHAMPLVMITSPAVISLFAAINDMFIIQWNPSAHEVIDYQVQF